MRIEGLRMTFRVQAAVEEAQREKEAMAARQESLLKDVDSLRALHRAAQAAYERQVGGQGQWWWLV